MARKPIGEKLDGLKVLCHCCCIVNASTPALILESARKYVADKWGFIVTPSGHDLCRFCARDGEHLNPPYSVPPPIPPTPKAYAIPDSAFPMPKIKRNPRPNKTPKPKRSK